MKPHLLLTLNSNVQAPARPHWQALLKSMGKRERPQQLFPELDRIFARYQIPVWTTQEYQPADGSQWNSTEIQSGLNRVYRLILQRQQHIPTELIKSITLIPAVQSVRIGTVARSSLPTPLAAATSITSDRKSREAIFLPDAHNLTKGSSEIVIAVLDTGVQTDHPEFRDRLLSGYDFVDILHGADKFLGDYLGADADPSDEVGHGTHVTGIIAAQGERMPIGVAPLCRILPVRVLGALKQGNRRVGAGLVDNINNGIKWAVDQGAHIINMSLGIKHAGGGLPHASVIRYAQAKGVIVVAAAGNDGQEELYYPGALPGVVTVGAVDVQGQLASFSTYGKHVTLVAPGTEIYSTYRRGGYAFSSGTSQASPFVAGAIALLQSRALAVSGHRLSPSQIMHLLKHTADKLDRRFRHPKAGFGVLNLRDALTLLDHRLRLRHIA